MAQRNKDRQNHANDRRQRVMRSDQEHDDRKTAAKKDAIEAMQLVKDAWFERKLRGEAMWPIIFKRLNQSSDPLYLALEMCVSSPDYKTTSSKDIQNSLALCVVESYVKWLMRRTPSALSSLSSDLFNGKLQMHAFQVAAGQDNFELIHAICVGYHLRESEDVHKELSVMHTNELWGALCGSTPCDKIGLISQFVVALSWQKLFPILQLAMPLYLLGHDDLFMKYLASDRDTAVEFVTYMDKFCDGANPNAAKVLLELLSGIKAIPSKLEPNAVYKALGDIVKANDVPMIHCPRRVAEQEKRTLTKLVMWYYDNVIISDIDFDDMMIDYVSNITSLQLIAVDLMYEKKDWARVLRYVQKWNLPRASLSTKVQSFTDTYAASTGLPFPTATRHQKVASSDYPTYQLDSTVRIDFVDSVAKYEACLRDIANNAKIVSFDMEWKAITRTPKKLAMMQLAYKHRVYLLDFFDLDNVLEPRHYHMLLDLLFLNPEILKIGFCCGSDFAILKQTHHILKDNICRSTNVCDMRMICKKFVGPTCSNLNVNKPEGASLVKFAEFYLGFTVDKLQCLSFWERRPLNNAQIEYAAIDAHILLHLESHIRKFSKCWDVNFDEIKLASMYKFPALDAAARDDGGQTGGGVKQSNNACELDVCRLGGMTLVD